MLLLAISQSGFSLLYAPAASKWEETQMCDNMLYKRAGVPYLYWSVPKVSLMLSLQLFKYAYNEQNCLTEVLW